MSDALTTNQPMPAMFFLPEVWERVECPLPGYQGLWVEIRVNLRNFERQAIVTERVDPKRQPALLERVCAWVRDWNLYDRGAGGAPVRVPPPAELGSEVWNLTDPAVNGWILDALQFGYRGGKGSSGSPSPSGNAPEPGNGQSAAEPPATTTPRSRRNRRNSSSPNSSPTGT